MEHTFTADQIAIACADASLSDAQCESLLLALHYTPAPVQPAQDLSQRLASIRQGLHPNFHEVLNEAVAALAHPPADAAPVDAKPVAHIDPAALVALEYERKKSNKNGPYARKWAWAHPADKLVPLYAAQPSPAQGDALKQQAFEDGKRFAHEQATVVTHRLMAERDAAHQQGRAAGIKEVAKIVQNLSAENEDGDAALNKANSAILRALNKQEPTA